VNEEPGREREREREKERVRYPLEFPKETKQGISVGHEVVFRSAFREILQRLERDERKTSSIERRSETEVYRPCDHHFDFLVYSRLGIRLERSSMMMMMMAIIGRQDKNHAYATRDTCPPRRKVGFGLEPEHHDGGG